jgi:predicted metal-binding membrane protein
MLDRRRPALAAALRWWPEWRIAIVITLAWGALMAGAGGHVDATPERAPRASTATAHDDHAHRGYATPPTSSHSGSLHHSNGALGALAHWTLMAVAMMGPVALPAVRHVGLNSIRSRREWAMALYFAVYVAVWVAFGAVALTGDGVVRAHFGIHGDVLLPIALVVAAAWQLTRAKRRALFRCHKTVPLPPAGRRANFACVHFALAQGWRCVVSCWPLMIVMAVGGHSGVAWMTLLTALILIEELTFVGRRLMWPSAAALALAALLLAIGSDVPRRAIATDASFGCREPRRLDVEVEGGCFHAVSACPRLRSCDPRIPVFQ